MADPKVTLRVTADTAGLKVNLGQARGEVDRFARAGETGGKRVTKSMRETEESAARLSKGIGRLVGQVSAGLALAQYVRLSDTYANISGRLRIVTKDEQSYRAALDQTYAVAQRTYSGLESTAELYGRMQKATNELGRSQADALRTTELINKSFGISGTAAATANASIIQLAQGLGAGALRGDEFNSVMEGAPRLADALSASLGVSRGELRQMAADGKLTADIIIDALLKQGDVIDSEFARLPVTSARAWEQVKNAALRSVGEIDQVIGGSGSLARGLQALAELIERVPNALSIWEEEFSRIRGVGDGFFSDVLDNLDLIGINAAQLGEDIANTFLVFPAAARAAITIVIGEFDKFGHSVGAAMALLVVEARKAWLGIESTAVGLASQLQIIIGGALDKIATFYADLIKDIAAGAQALGLEKLAGQLTSMAEKLDHATASEAELTAQAKASAEVYKQRIETLEASKVTIREALAADKRRSDESIAASLAEFDAAKKRAAAERELAKASTETGAAVLRAGEAVKSYADDLKLGATSSDKWSAALRKKSDALDDLRDLVIGASADLSGPMLEALEDNQRELDRLNELTEILLKLGPEQVEVMNLLAAAYDAVAAAAARRVAQARQEEDVFANLTQSYEREIYLAGLSTNARNTEFAVERALEYARRTRGETYAQEHEAEIRRLVESGEANLRLAEISGEAADASERAWLDATAEMGRAVGDWVTGGIKSFGDFVDRIKDMFKRMLADLIAQMVQSGLLRMVASLFGGSAPGAAFAGAGNGGLGSLLSSAGGGGAGFGALLPVAGAVLGGGFGLTQRGSSTGSLGSIGAAAAYGTAGYIGGTIAYGATLGAAAGAGTAAGAVGGAASGALGAAGAIPVVGWIIAAIAAIDMITGGKVFGTRYRPESSETRIGIGPDGGSASASVREVRQRALFQGRRWRTRDIEAGEDAEAGAVALFDSIAGIMADSARQLAAEAPPVIDAAIRTVIEYDKKGKETARKILVDVLGRTWEEATAELAATRISAEAIIQTIDAALGGVAEAVADTASDAVSAGAGGAGRGLGETILRDLKSAAVRGEASAIAERWRNDAEELYAGAQFLLAAATDIRAGTALLGEDSTLTEITELTEQLQQAGEPLLATYQRMVVSTKLLDDALSLSGVQLDLTREEFVRFATDIADAAGGIERAQSLWSSYFQNFYSDSERAALALDSGRARASSEFADIGLDLSDFTGDGGAAAFRSLFEEMLPTLSAEAVVEWLEAADALGIVIDLQAQYSAALGAAAKTLDDLMTGIESRISSLEPEQVLSFDERGAAIQADTDLLLARAEELGASEEDLQRIRYLGQLRMDQLNDERYAAYEQQVALLQAYRAEVQSIADVIDERNFSEFQIELRDIYRWGAEAADSLNAAARAAGMEVAAARDLALVHEEVAFRVAAAIARLRERGRDLVAQLQGTPLSNIEQQIATLEAAQQSYVNSALGGIEQITQASDNAYTAQVNAQQRIREFLDNLLIGPLGGLRPRDALIEAQAQFDALLERALGGDVEAQAALPALAQQLLQLGQQVYASGDPYFALRDSIIEALEQVAALPVPEPTITPDPVGTGGGGGGGTVDIGASPELQALYAERDRLLAEQTAAQQLALAQEVAGIIRDLVAATGDPLLEIAASLGLNLNQLVAQLGVNLDDLTVTTAIQLADVAQAMGVNLSELSAAVGVDLGNLADAQSLLNDALEDRINALPEAERDLLRPLLKDVEDAARLGDKEGTELALADLILAVNDLDPMFRDLFAPFFSEVDPTTYNELSALTNIDDYTRLAKDALELQTPILDDIRANLRASNQELGFPSYQVGTGYVPRTGLATLHQGEIVLPTPVADFFRREGLPLPSREIQSEVVADEIRALRRERREADAEINRRLQAVENATNNGAAKQADAIKDQGERLARAGR